MQLSKIAKKTVLLSVSGAVFWGCLQVILLLGVEKKSIFAIFADIFGGGTVGAGVGLIFFLLFGAVGFVSGALYGAIGLISLMVGGALGGLGFGAIIHIARNPSHYRFNIPVILIGLLVTAIIVVWVYKKIGDLYDTHGPSLVQWVLGKLEK